MTIKTPSDLVKESERHLNDIMRMKSHLTNIEINHTMLQHQASMIYDLARLVRALHDPFEAGPPGA